MRLFFQKAVLAQLVAQADHGLGVDLGNPGLGDVQGLADLFHGHLVAVVHGDHQALFFGERFDVLGQGVLDLFDRGQRKGIVPFVVGQIVEEVVLFLLGGTPDLFEADKGTPNNTVITDAKANANLE